MKYTLTSVISSIISAKGEDIIDRPDDFIRVLCASAPDTKHYAPTIEVALKSGAVMMIAQARNDDEIGQTNAVKIAIEILINEAQVDKDTAIEVSVAFAAAFGYIFNGEKSNKQLIEDAKAHIAKNENDNALKILEDLDKKGDNEAQYLLAVIYYNGIGTPVSYKKAIHYLEKSATADAYTMLARLYVEGKGCTKDNNKAVELWGKAADMGSAAAEYQLATIYMKGLLGRSVDIKKAAAYLKSSAQKGFDIAVKAYAALPREQKTLTKDELQLLKETATKGDIKSIYSLGNCYFKGDGVPQSKSKAIEYYTKAAKLGHFPSMVILITRYTMDADITPSWSAAKHWYERAKTINKERLASIHPNLLKGEDIFLSAPKTAKNKVKRLEEAGKLGYISAYTAIGKMYLSSDKAIPYLKIAADAGDIDAIDLLLPLLTDTNEISSYSKLRDYAKACLTI